MKRGRLAKKIKEDSEEFLERNPDISEALRLFDVSYERYKMATEPGYFYTDVSTSPSQTESSKDFKSRSQ